MESHIKIIGNEGAIVGSQGKIWDNCRINNFYKSKESSSNKIQEWKKSNHGRYWMLSMLNIGFNENYRRFDSFKDQLQEIS